MRRIGTVKRIHIKHEKGQPREGIQEGRFVTGHGLEGDLYSSGKVQVVALSWAARQETDRSEEPGLCFERFVETLTLDWEDYQPSPGHHFQIGEAEFEVETIGKRCFPECRILEQGRRCALAFEAVHLGIVRTGTIAIGDVIWLRGDDSDDSSQRPEEGIHSKQA